MRCPFCYYEDTRVVDSRDSDEGIRRRRECLAGGCGRRFTTVEKPQLAAAFVIKKDGRREEFSREKLLSGLRKACDKRPLAASQVEGIADYIEAAIAAQGAGEVPSTWVGELVMDQLRGLDDIAYIRFASVYRSFRDVDELKDELATLERRDQVGRQTPPAANQLPLLPQEALTSLAPGEGGPANKLVKRGRGRPRKTEQPGRQKAAG